MSEEKKQENRTDEELVVLARGGDKGAMETLLVRYKEFVSTCTRGFFLSGLDAEDLLQEGMIGLFSAICDYKAEHGNGATFKTFAYLCIRRQIIDTVKRRCKEIPTAVCVSLFEWEGEAKEENPEDVVIAAETRQEFTKKISKVLSDYEFRVVMMYIDGMNYGEIAESTKKSVKSVDNALQRSKRKLLELLKNEKQTA